MRPVQKSERKSKIDHTPSQIEDVDETSFVGSDLYSAIETGLTSLPEIRQERLESGEKLVSDPDYPGEEGLEELTKLTLKNLPPKEEDPEET